MVAAAAAAAAGSAFGRTTVGNTLAGGSGTTSGEAPAAGDGDGTPGGNAAAGRAGSGCTGPGGTAVPAAGAFHRRPRHRTCRNRHTAGRQPRQRPLLGFACCACAGRHHVASCPVGSAAAAVRTRPRADVRPAARPRNRTPRTLLTGRSTDIRSSRRLSVVRSTRAVKTCLSRWTQRPGGS